MNIKSSERGVGLVEVLVAVLLLSVAVLGFSALQLRAISATDESLVRTQAMSVIRGLSENMRSNSLQLDAYEDAVNDPVATEPTIGVGSCLSLTDSCTDVQIAAKEAKIAVNKLKGYGIEAKMVTCPGTATVSFSEVKCIIAAWGDTKPLLSNSDDKACATESGIYKSGSTCSIIEAY